jgi:hypothetical protein
MECHKEYHYIHYVIASRRKNKGLGQTAYIKKKKKPPSRFPNLRKKAEYQILSNLSSTDPK